MDMAHEHSFTKNTNPESSTILIGFEDIMKWQPSIGFTRPMEVQKRPSTGSTIFAKIIWYTIQNKVK
jgi:hypothetical protein